MEGGIVTEEYSRFYRIIFDIHRKYAPCPKDTDAWAAAAEEMAEVCCKNGNHPFLMAMLNAVNEELEIRYKQA